ncbi:uncharacterized protein Rv2226/MT2285 [Arthrobacter sp. Hiyo4]|nr:uncharacterized protein Rv2226/MT2285 [Arthrobacter sp. Hiyo4]
MDTLEAVYFDTQTHTLASRDITLRRRTGGVDAGWHLKLAAEGPGSDDESGEESDEDSGEAAGGSGSEPGGAGSCTHRWASPASFLTACWRTCWPTSAARMQPRWSG